MQVHEESSGRASSFGDGDPLIFAARKEKRKRSPIKTNTKGSPSRSDPPQNMKMIVREEGSLLQDPGMQLIVYTPKQGRKAPNARKIW